jgi:hypothetical protein
MITLLTEAASVRIATPIEQKPSDLRGHARGLPRYEQRVSFPFKHVHREIHHGNVFKWRLP